MVIAYLFLLHLSSCYASPVRSPRTSAVKLRNILANMQRVTRSDQPSSRQDYQHENALATNNNQYLLPTTEDVPEEKPETIDDPTAGSFNNPDPTSVLTDVSDETEQPLLATDAEIFHSELPHSEFIETVTPSSDIQGVIEAESYFMSVGAEEEPLSNNVVLPQVSTGETSEFVHHLPTTVAATSDPAELPLMYPLVRVPIAPSSDTPIIAVADLPLETVLFSPASALPEKVEIGSSPESQDHSSPGISEPEQNDSAHPLDLDPKVTTQTSPSPYHFDSPIQVDQPKYHPNISYDIITNDNNNPVEKDNSSSRPFGSTPQLRELGFPPISNTQDNFGVQVNWAKFR